VARQYKIDCLQIPAAVRTGQAS